MLKKGKGDGEVVEVRGYTQILLSADFLVSCLCVRMLNISLRISSPIAK